MLNRLTGKGDPAHTSVACKIAPLRALCLFIVIIAALFLLPDVARADDDNLSATMKVRLVDQWSSTNPTYTSTAAMPAHLAADIDFGTYRYGQNLFVNLADGTYSGLSPNTEYQGTVTLFCPDGSTKDFSIGNVTTGDAGEGNFTANFNFTVMPDQLGVYHVELKLKSGDEEHILGADHSDNRYAFVVGGFDGLQANHLYVTKNQSAFNPHLQIVTPDDAAEGVEITRKAILTFLKPNTSYILVDRLVEYNASGGYVGVKHSSTKSFTTDKDGNAVIEYSLGEFTDLVSEHRYTMESNVWETSYAMTNGYEYRFDMPLSSCTVIVLGDDPVPEDKGTNVDLTVNVLDEKTKSPLKGAKMRIVKGDSTDGETVATWTSDGKKKSFSLPLGKYMLIEDAPPPGYEGKPPTSFELTPDKALIRGYAFAAYTDYATIKNDFSFYEMYYHKYGETSTSELAYCINRGMYDPSPMDQFDFTRLFYEENLVKDTELLDNVTNKELTAEELNDNIKRVIYNGHPTNASGIKEKYGLDDEEFRFITQQAVHHYTDGANWSGEQLGGEQNYIDAYNELINCKNAAPTDMILRVYIADNNHYQSLVSAEFKSGLGLDLLIANTKKSEGSGQGDGSDDDDTAPDNVAPSDDEASKDGNGAGTDTGDELSLSILLLSSIMAVLLSGLILQRRQS